jgi:NADPH:quinone reductase-like Zn-dependent oxidoreductase
MRADICAEYRWPDVLQLKEMATPTPQDDEALVRMHALSVNAADLESLKGCFCSAHGGGASKTHAQSSEPT